MMRRGSDRPSKYLLPAIVVSILLIISIANITPVCALDEVPSNLNTGPYVNSLVYHVIGNQDQRVQALQAGTIVMDTSFFDPVHLNTFTADPDIDIFNAARWGYLKIDINCREYPLNISGLRRAFAFAYNKTKVKDTIWDGLLIEHDSLVVQPSGFCIEDEFDWHYYDARPDIGNLILDDLGFEIDNSTGFRNAPDGSAFRIRVGHASSSMEIAGGVALIGVDALLSLHIDAERVFTDYNGFQYSEMVVYGQNFYSNDVEWLAYEYWSANAEVDGINTPGFINTTYDSWRDQLLHGTTYEEVYEASAEMQKILQYNVPSLVAYENIYQQAYRNDTFTGYVEELGGTISGQWTMRKIHRIDSHFRGTVPIAIAEVPDSFNMYVTNSQYSAAILTNLYSSLYRYGPDMNPYPDLATNLIIETHEDNAAVPAGYMRFTIDILQNATWSDGTPLTSQDIVTTFTYQYESTSYGNPAGLDLEDLSGVYAPNPYRVVIEFSSESYWHFSVFAFDYIIPNHIFNQVDGIRYDEWDSWNPVYDSGDPMVTSGPFKFTEYRSGEWFEVSRNPLFYYLDQDTPPNDKPTIFQGENVTYVEGTTGNQIEWRVEDDNPFQYRITRNGTLQYEQDWDGTNITCNIDGLVVGTYKYILTLYDRSDNTAQSIIYVTVLSNTSVTSSDTITNTNTGGGAQTIAIQVGIIAIVISAGSAVVIIYCSKEIAKKRRELAIVDTDTEPQSENTNP